ncbi:MAG: hypothetical protein AVDCRST_MAG77-4308 [uncultured Chloroflexi bacterium]|uniref:Uncharacterized protein n=1 Tax=uncultured Chloroflexota bacterium TaxID=166587 RepID=A0A6J4JIB8_9CHLR|nr:MAG: hypothetical protein AVDCRST_MAG77-4308 [uncultured Chloroflexota bacterium]
MALVDGVRRVEAAWRPSHRSLGAVRSPDPRRRAPCGDHYA